MSEQPTDTTWVPESKYKEDKKQAYNEGYESGKNAANSELRNYKNILRETVLEFMSEYDLCQDGVKRFCDAMNIPVKFEREVKITLTFTVHGTASDQDIDDAIDSFGRSITEVGFMERNLGELQVEDENYDYEVD